MRKLSLLLVVGAVALMAAPALAQNYTFEASTVNITSSTTLVNGIYQRTWAGSAPGINTQCDNNCANKPCGETYDGDKVCKLNWAGKGVQGYRGALDNIANYPPALFGDIFNSVFDAELNRGAANHTGYYSWVTGPVVSGATDFWADVNCAGTQLNSCLGNANTNNSHSVAGTPQGTIATIGGLSPIPVPRATDIDGDGNAYSVGGIKGTFELRWDAVTSVGASAGANPVGYDLYYFKTPPSGGVCPAAPTEASAWVFLKTVAAPTAQTTVGFADIGMASATEPQCVTYALRLRFPANSLSHQLTTRYLSANGQTFGTAQAVSIYDFKSVNIKTQGRYGKNEVSWRVSDESGVQRYELYRSPSMDGPWAKVTTITADGSPGYSYIDSLDVSKGALAKYNYKLDVVDQDQSITTVGPVATQK